MHTIIVLERTNMTHPHGLLDITKKKEEEEKKHFTLFFADKHATKTFVDAFLFNLIGKRLQRHVSIELYRVHYCKNCIMCQLRILN